MTGGGGQPPARDFHAFNGEAGLPCASSHAIGRSDHEPSASKPDSCSYPVPAWLHRPGLHRVQGAADSSALPLVPWQDQALEPAPCRALALGRELEQASGLTWQALAPPDPVRSERRLHRR